MKKQTILAVANNPCFGSTCKHWINDEIVFNCSYPMIVISKKNECKLYFKKYLVGVKNEKHTA